MAIEAVGAAEEEEEEEKVGEGGTKAGEVEDNTLRGEEEGNTLRGEDEGKVLLRAETSGLADTPQLVEDLRRDLGEGVTTETGGGVEGVKGETEAKGGIVDATEPLLL